MGYIRLIEKWLTIRLLERTILRYWESSQSPAENKQRDNVKNTVLIKNIPALPRQLVPSDLSKLKQTNLAICDGYSVYLDFKQLKGQLSYEVIEQKMGFCTWTTIRAIN